MAEIHHQVWVDAPIATVYNAISTASGVSSWWDPQTERDIDGKLVFEHSAGPLHGTVQLQVLKLLPNTQVKWECISTHPSNTPAHWWTGTQFSFELTDRATHAPAITEWATAIPAQTILEFRHSGWDKDSPYFGFCSFAWGFVLNNLKQVCEAS